MEIAVEDPRTPDVRALLDRHLAFAHATTAAEFVFALDVEELVDPRVTFLTGREHGELLGVGALKELGGGEAEIKSMHTAEAARGRGVARALVEHMVGLARERGLLRVSLETGAQDAFAPARALYAACGFVVCSAFGDYPDTPSSVFLTRALASESAT